MNTYSSEESRSKGKVVIMPLVLETQVVYLCLVMYVFVNGNAVLN